MLFVHLFFWGGLHKTLLQITTCCHFWVRNNAVGLWCCRWGHGCYDTSLHAAASSSSASCQSWMAWKRATSRLAPKPHGKMTWDIYFKICSNVPTPCEKNLVQYYQKYVLFFWSHWLQTSPCFSSIAKVTRCDTSSQRPWLRKLRKRFAKDQLCLRWHNCVML